MSEQDKALLREFLAAGERGEVDRFDNYLTKNTVEHNPFPGQPQGIEGAKQIFKQMTEAVPDLSMPQLEIISEGDKVAAVGKVKGQQTGDMPGMPATGKPFDVYSVDWARVQGGKFAEHWGLIDFATMFRQTGVQPIPSGLENWKPVEGKAPKSGAIGSPQENKDVLHHMVDLINSGKIDQLLLLIHPEAVDHTPLPGEGTGRAGFEYRFNALTNGFSDTEFAILDQISEGDLVSSRYTFRGKHTGEMMGMPPTNKPVEVDAIDMIRLRDGHLVEHWGLLDFPAMMMQLGMGQP